MAFWMRRYAPKVIIALFGHDFVGYRRDVRRSDLAKGCGDVEAAGRGPVGLAAGDGFLIPAGGDVHDGSKVGNGAAIHAAVGAIGELICSGGSRCGDVVDEAGFRNSVQI